jgi:hypothetical protein
VKLALSLKQDRQLRHVRYDEQFVYVQAHTVIDNRQLEHLALPEFAMHLRDQI